MISYNEFRIYYWQTSKSICSIKKLQRGAFTWSEMHLVRCVNALVMSRNADSNCIKFCDAVFVWVCARLMWRMIIKLFCINFWPPFRHISRPRRAKIWCRCVECICRVWTMRTLSALNQIAVAYIDGVNKMNNSCLFGYIMWLSASTSCNLHRQNHCNYIEFYLHEVIRVISLNLVLARLINYVGSLAVFDKHWSHSRDIIIQ